MSDQRPHPSFGHPPQTGTFGEGNAAQQFTMIVQAVPLLRMKPRPLENTILRTCGRCGCMTMQFVLGAGLYECSECGLKT